MKRFLPLAATVLALALAACNRPPGVDPARQKAFAIELLSRQLYAESAAAFDRYVEMPGVTDDERAKVLFRVANTLMNDARDYHGALLRFLRLKSFHPAFRDRDVSVGIVTCLEKTGRSLEAQLALEESSSLKKGPGRPSSGGVVLAEVGGRTITDRDLRDEVHNWPREARARFESPEGKRQLLQSLVAQELLFDVAVRRGLAEDPGVVRQVETVRRNLMISRAVQEEFGDSLKVSPMEIELFYEAHKDRFVESGKKDPPPLAEVRSRVEAEVRQAKQWKVLQRLVDRSLKAREVKMYPDRVR